MFSDNIERGKSASVNISLAFYIILEFLILSFLLFKIIKSKTIKKYILWGVVFFLAFNLYSWLYLNPWIQYLTTISTTSSVLMIFPSLYYFYELIKTPKVPELSQEPSFWIVTGILFLFLWITPLYLICRAMAKIPELKLIDYLAYILIIVLFTKASLCKSQSIQ
jgi:hypothetical protein